MIKLIADIVNSIIQDKSLTSVMEAEVITEPPNLSIKIKNNPKLIIKKSQILISEYLTLHNRDIEGYLGNKYTITFEDELKPGDKIVVISLDNGQRYLIIDRLKLYS